MSAHPQPAKPRVRRAASVANHSGVVVFPAAGLAVIVSSALVHGVGLEWWDAEEAASLTAVLAYLGAKLEGWRRSSRDERLAAALRRGE